MSNYCRLKDSVRLRKDRNYCICIDIEYHKQRYLSFPQGFLLSLCNGEITIEDMERINFEVLGISRDKFSAMNFLKSMPEYVEFLPIPKPARLRYDPKEYLAAPQNPADNRLYPLLQPLEMTLCLTDKCNFRCVYCFKSSGSGMRNELSTGQWLDIIRQAAELGVLRCNVTGGEPTLSKSFLAVLSSLKKYGIYAYISTNGSTLTKNTARQIKDTGIDTIQFSLDCVDDVLFNAMTSTINQRWRVLSGISAAAAAGLKIKIKSVITSINCGDVGALLDYCHEHGVSEITLDRYNPGCKSRGGKSLFLSGPMMEDIRETVSAKTRQYPGISIVSALKPLRWQKPEDISYCGGLFTAFAVQPNGDMGACEQLPHVEALTVGNLRKTKLKDLWFSGKSLAFLNPSKESAKYPCNACDYFSTCRTGCPAHTLMYSDNYLDPDPKCWKVNIDPNPIL